MASKYELAMELFGNSSIVAQGKTIRVILNVEPPGELLKVFTQEVDNNRKIHVRHLIWFLRGLEVFSVRASTTRELSSWEFLFRYVESEQVSDNDTATISTKKNFHLDFDVDTFLAEELAAGNRPKRNAYVPSPDYNPNSETSFWNECRRIADWIEENQPERNKINLAGFQTWNRLVPLMDKVVSGIAAGAWEKVPPDKSMETAYYAWELELNANQTQTVSITGDVLSTLVTAIAVADSTSLEFGCYAGGSGLTVLLSVDDTFSA